MCCHNQLNANAANSKVLASVLSECNKPCHFCFSILIFTSHSTASYQHIYTRAQLTHMLQQCNTYPDPSFTCIPTKGICLPMDIWAGRENDKSNCTMHTTMCVVPLLLSPLLGWAWFWSQEQHCCAVLTSSCPHMLPLLLGWGEESLEALIVPLSSGSTMKYCPCDVLEGKGTLVLLLGRGWWQWQW